MLIAAAIQQHNYLQKIHTTYSKDLKYSHIFEFHVKA